MADVGVLSLEIQANAGNAEQKLNAIAGALEAVKSAVSGANIGTAASALKRLNDAVSVHTITNLNGVANALQKIQNACNFSVQSLSGLRRAMEMINSTATTGNAASSGIWKTADDIATVAEAKFSDVGQAVEEAKGKVEEFKSTVETTEVNSHWLEDAHALNQQFVEITKAVDETFEDRYNSRRAFGAALRGELGENAQLYAIKAEAKATETSIDEVKAKIEALQTAATAAKAPVQELMSTISKSSGEGIKSELGEMGKAASEISSAASGLKKVADSGKEAKKSLSGVERALHGIRDAVQHSMLGQLTSRLFQISRYRMLRAIIKNIADGIKEGFTNYKTYSEKVGNKFSKELASVNAQVTTMKNSMGAAIAPALSAAIPILQQIASAATTAFNAVNQLISLLTGASSWSRAVNVTQGAMDIVSGADEASKKTKENMASAAKSTKDMLADWDELNIIQSSSGGGGGGGGNNLADALAMFETTNIFDETLKKFVETMNEQFGSALELVKKIGELLLAWKLSTALTGILGRLAAWWAEGLIIDLTFNLTQLFDKMFLDTGDMGWLIGDILTTLIGSVLATKAAAQIVGTGAAGIFVPLIMTVSAVASLVANVGRTDVSALSKESLLMDVLTGLKMGTGAAYLAHTFMGTSLGTSIKGGMAIALGVFGVSLGIKATVEAIQSGVTLETVKAAALASLAVGLGTAGMASVLGASLGGALALGAIAAGATIATITAAIGIAALLKLAENNPIDWGSYSATEEEIKAFVENEVFEVDAQTKLNLLNPKIEVAEADKEKLTATVEEVKLTVTKIKLGYDSDEVLEDLKKQIFGNGEDETSGLLGQFRQTVKDQQTLIETAIMLVPTAAKDESGNTKDIIDTSSQGWTNLTSHMEDLGRQLTGAMERAYSEEIGSAARKMEMETISQLTSMMAKVAAAITKGEAWAVAQQSLTTNLSNLNKGSWDELFNYVETYSNDVISATEQAFDEVTQALGGQMFGAEQAMQNALELAHGDTSNADYLVQKEAYEAAYERYHSWVEGRDKALEQARKDSMDPATVQKIKEAFLQMVTGSVDNIDFNSAMLDLGYDQERMSSFVTTALFGSNGEALRGAGLEISDMFNSMLYYAFGPENYDSIKKAIDLGFLSYGDFFSTEFISMIADKLGVSGQSPEIQAAWTELVSNFFDDPVKFIQEAKESMESVGTPEIDTSATEDSATTMETIVKEATSEVNDAIKSVGGSTGAVDGSPTDGSLAALESSVASRVNHINSMLASIGGFGGGLTGNVRIDNMSRRINVPLRGYANGGFPDSGSIFMADENGQIEMKGMMGSQPVVANNQQIIAGISEGVTRAQSEQNSILERQYEILREIWRKSGNAVVTASSQIGRVNARSNRMYERVTGG